MTRCEFTPQSRADLEQIHDYISQDSPENALRFVNRIERQCDSLADYPYIGVERPEFGRGTRSIVMPNTAYIIFYRPANEGVEILRVLHGSQDLRRRMFE